MSDYQTHNYTAHGGRETVIGGKLTFLPGAVVEGLAEAIEMEKLAHQPDSQAATVAALREDFNALLGKLRAAGYMEVLVDEVASE
jgi:hypothetical protein